MNFSTKTDQEILAIAEPIWESISQGSNEVNYEKFSKHFSKKMLQAVPETELRRQIEEIHPEAGFLLPDRDFISCIHHETGVSVLWKGRMSKANGECLLVLLLDEEDSEIKVFSAWFRNFTAKCKKASENSA